MKRIRRILLALLLLVVLALVGSWIFIDTIVKTGIEKGGSYALQVDTTVDDVSLSLLRGRLSIDNLTIANPPKFETPHLMIMNHFALAVDRGSLLSDTVTVHDFVIDGLDINIEQKLTGNNVSVIMKNLERFQSSGEQPPPTTPEEDTKGKPGGKKIKVDRILVKNIVAHIQPISGAGKLTTLTVKIDELPFDNVTSDNAAGVTIPTLTQRLIPAILMAVLEKGGDIIPGDLSKDLRRDVGGFMQGLGAGAIELPGQIGKGIENVGKGVGKGIEGVGKGLKDLINNKKKEEDQ